MTCATCGGYGAYNAGTRYSCRDDGDGWVFCECLAGARRALREGGTCFMDGIAGKRLLDAGEHLSEKEYALYKKGCEFMGWTVYPNNAEAKHAGANT